MYKQNYISIYINLSIYLSVCTYIYLYRYISIYRVRPVRLPGIVLIDLHLGVAGVAQTAKGGSGIMVVKKGSFHSGIAENASRASKATPTAFGFRPSRARRSRKSSGPSAHAARNRTLLSWQAWMLFNDRMLLGTERYCRHPKAG